MSAYGKSANDSYRTVPLVTDSAAHRAGVLTCPACGHTMPATAPVTAIEGN